MERSSDHINPELFEELVRLSIENDWLRILSYPLAELWNYCETDRERSLLKLLISRMVYLDSRDLYSICQHLADLVIKGWDLEANNTYFVAFGNSMEADGSQFYLQSIKMHFSGKAGWKEKNFKNTIGAIHEIPNNCAIILVDDFVGSGKTFERRIKYVQDNLKKEGKYKSTIYFSAVASMKASISIIEGYNIQYYVAHQLKKGISDYDTGEDLQQNINIMNELESRLGNKYNKKRLSDFRFGYKQSEALYSLEAGSTPNNVFPIFWWPVRRDNSYWTTLFKRL